MFLIFVELFLKLQKIKINNLQNYKNKFNNIFWQTQRNSKNTKLKKKSIQKLNNNNEFLDKK